MVPQKIKIPDWPYYLTIDGYVYREGSEKPLKQTPNRFGYVVTLSNKNIKKQFRLSTLMRNLYFCGNPLPMKHLDGDKSNFSYWNLKPMPRSEIPNYERPQGWNAKAVIETEPDGTENIYQSAAECARKLFISPSCVRRWCCGKSKPSINNNTYRWEE